MLCEGGKLRANVVLSVSDGRAGGPCGSGYVWRPGLAATRAGDARADAASPATLCGGRWCAILREGLQHVGEAERQ